MGAIVTACTHLGRPDGHPDPRYDVEPVESSLAEMIPGVQLLENLRFSPGEKGNDPAFVLKLIEGQDVLRQRRLRGLPPSARLGRRAAEVPAFGGRTSHAARGREF